MSEKTINEILNRITIQDKVIEHLLIRSELSLHLLSTVLPISGLSIDAVKHKIETFNYLSPAVDLETLYFEKRKFINML